MYKMTAIIALTISFSAHAHDVWLEQKQDGLALIYGHVDELVELEPEKVRAIRAYGVDGIELSIDSHSGAGEMLVKPEKKAAMVTVEYDNGFWTKIDPTTWENKSKRHYENHLDSSHSYKYNKNLMGWSNQFTQPSGLRMEIVPLENPLAVKAGGRVSLQVLYQGSPLPDTALEVHGIDDTFRTDENGRVEVLLDSKRKFQHIAAYYRYELPGNLDADEMSLTANLVFGAD